MSEISPEAVQSVLESFLDPETGRNVVETGQIADLSVDTSRISLTLGMTTFAAPIAEEQRAELFLLLQTKFPQVEEIDIKLGHCTRPPMAKGQVGLMAKKVIAVGSGKGGVGKSTVAVSLASALKQMGSKVGLLDADVYGPSVPHLLGLSEEGIRIDDQERMIPVDCDGMPVHSMGFLVPKEEAVVWRGPMLHGSLVQMLGKTVWGELDYLIVDMPPGTGDVPLTLSQVIAPDGVVVVCTPQEVALLDAVKAIAMFRKLRIPILGIVENMSGFLCQNCQTTHDVFGTGGAKREAERLDIPFLGEIPLHIPIREHGDAGQAGALSTDSQVAPFFERIAFQIVKGFAQQASAEPPNPELPVLD